VHVAIVEYLDGRSTEPIEKASDTLYGASCERRLAE
jgi:hypothetical protein